ncbi:MAG: recombinase [Halomonas sp.]|nr:recombinase [Halomonas sp.]|tara:strand:- start:23311 stop:24423 length:1113 start_codon:yes stop_codon:yes gene_type:complete
MKVTLRQRRKGKRISLYLDYYENGNRKYEYLKLYLTPEPDKGSLTKAQKLENKKILQLAESIRAKRHLEIQNNIYGFENKEKKQGNFFVYLEQWIERRSESKGNLAVWNSTLKHLKAYYPSGISFERIDEEWVEGFKEYLDKKALSRSKRELSQNTKSAYFKKLLAVLRQAVKEKVIQYNPAIYVENFKEEDTHMEFLTLEEVRKLFSTDSKHPQLKNAFLFSCLTGLRWSDITKLQWSEIQYSESYGNFIRFKQKKTKGAETLPISEQAFEMLGEKGEPTQKVFENINNVQRNYDLLKDWVGDAEIKKNITFHCARHSFATLQLTLGTDIYTVSKMLGHKNLKTTQIYAKVIDDKKKQAAYRINLNPNG